MKKLIILFSLLLILDSCGDKNKTVNEKLLSRIDSLENSLAANEYTSGLLEIVGQYMDSIDVHRRLIRINLETGISETNYVERMKNLSQYVRKAEWTIGELERTRSSYASQVKRLKIEVENTAIELQKMQLDIAEIQDEKDELEILLFITDDELIDTQVSLDFSEQELESANTEIMELMEKVKLTEAEIYYTQGEGIEKVIKHILFAPNKRKRKLEDALNAYSRAHDMGYIPAKEKVDQISSQLNKD